MVYRKATGTIVSGQGAVTPVWPTHVAGDVALLYVESCGGEPVTLSTPAGFAAVDNSPQATGAGTAGTQLSVFWCRATSSAQTDPVVADPGDHVDAVILTFAGCVPAGNPWEATSGGVKGAASTSLTITGLTTTSRNALVINAASRDDDSAAASFSAWANSGLILDPPEKFDGGTAQGNGGGIGIAMNWKELAGATGDTTATVVSSVNAFHSIALTPVTVASFLDDFNRTAEATNGWGIDWIISQGSPGNFSTSGTDAAVAGNTAGRGMIYGVAAAQNVDVSAKVSVSALPASSTQELQVHARVYRHTNALAEYYRANVFLDSAGAGTIAIERRVGGATTAIAGPVAAFTGVGAGDQIAIQLHAYGINPTQLSARAYKVGGAVPDWQVVANDSVATNLQAALPAGWRTSNNSATSIATTWEDFNAAAIADVVANAGAASGTGAAGQIATAMAAHAAAAAGTGVAGEGAPSVIVSAAVASAAASAGEVVAAVIAYAQAAGGVGVAGSPTVLGADQLARSNAMSSDRVMGRMQDGSRMTPDRGARMN